MATEADLKRVLNDRASDSPGNRVYGRDWNQNCQALMYQLCRLLGSAPQVYPSAKSAMYASGDLNTDRHAAPAGAFHYWGMGADGHVALSLGGERVLMGSARIQEAWATNAGVTTVTAYGGADYRGWSHVNGRNDISIEASQPAPAANTEWEYWEPTGDLARRVQRALSGMGRYNYPDGSARPDDGIFGVNTRKGVQKTLNVSGMFKGLEDGDIREGGCEGIQKYAKKFGGYNGPIDKKLGPNSWTGFAIGLEKK